MLVVFGTIRSNLDPFDLYDDASLWDALNRSYVAEPTNRDPTITMEEDASGGTHTPVSRFGLDTMIEDEGGNLSLGQVRLPSMALETFGCVIKKYLFFTEISRVFGSSFGQKRQDHHSRRSNR